MNEKEKISINEEDASELKLGAPYIDGQTQCLTISEANQLLLQKEEIESNNQNSIAHIQDWMDYTKRFSKFDKKEEILAVRKMLEEKGLHEFEIAVVGSLCPEKSDEALSYQGSLISKEDELNEVLDDMKAYLIDFQIDTD